MNGIEAKEPRCRPIYDEFERKRVSEVLSTIPIHQISFFLGSGESLTFWAEFAMLFLGPATFSFAPKLKRWLYAA